MVFTLGTLFEAGLLLVNAVAILNEEKFLKKIGWGRDSRNEGFQEQNRIKYQLVTLISSVQTLLRVPLMIVNILVIIYELLLGYVVSSRIRASSSSPTHKSRNQGAQRPLFEDLPSVVTFNQNERVGYVVVQVNCTSGEQITYRVLESVRGFDLNSRTGKLTLSSNAVDIDPGNYTFNFECYTSSPRNASQATLTVTRVEMNVFPPVFTMEGLLQVSLPENASINTLVTQVMAEDSDYGTNGRITYAITTSGADRTFSIDPSTGRITLRSTLDYEQTTQYQFVVTASDATSSASLIVTVNVDPIDDVAPTFESPTYTAAAPQISQAPVDVVRVSCTDPDTPSNRLSYAILTQPHAPFSMNPITGQLSGSAYRLDCNTTFFLLTVACFDNSELNSSSMATVEIIIQLERGNEPYVCQRLQSIYFILFETTPVNDIILSTLDNSPNQYRVCDDDCGSDGNVTYTVSADNSGVISDYFTLDLITGELVLSRSLDMDAPNTSLSTDLVISPPFVVKQVYFNIRGCDEYLPRRSCPTIADALIMLIYPLNEFDPHFSQPSYTAYVSELAQFDDLVLQVVCTDNDQFIGELDSITFSNATQVVRNTFHLNTETGEIRLTLHLDYETTRGYGFYLKCNDTSGGNDYATVTISVLSANDNDPEFLQSVYHFNASRTTPPNSYPIGRVAARDADVGNGSNLQYSALPNEYFDVSNDGTVFLINSVQNVTIPGYRFEARVEDEPGLNSTRVDTATVVVTFTDGNLVRPTFITGTRATEISELVTVGETILNLTCVDSEVGLNGLIRYYIRSGNSDQAFSIDSETGIITVQRLLTLPRGATQLEYYLDVICEDYGVPILSSNAIILVRVLRDDSRPPEITSNSSTIFVDENAPLNFRVATIVATDLDTDLLNFRFQNESDPGAFLIDPQTGTILVAQTLDREQVREYNMTVVVTEQRVIPGPERSDSVFLTILVRDVNDNSPQCDTSLLSVIVPDTISQGQAILTLNCSDLDVGSNSNLTYALDNNFNVLAVNSMGVIYLNGSLSDVDSNRLTTSVTVSDQGFPTPLSRSYFINIHLSSSNLHMPSFDDLPTSISLPESQDPQTVIYTVAATDEDRGSFGQLVYRIVNGSSDNTFEIIPNTGDILLRRKLDFFDQQMFLLTISVQDSDYRVVSTLNISVTDVNEFLPSCEENNTRWSIPEGIAPAAQVPFLLTCSDSDRGPNGEINYSIISGNGDNLFNVSDGGMVRLNQALDYEQAREHRLVIMVSDGGRPPMSILVVLLVNVEPVNEFAPVLFPTMYALRLPENTTVGTVILTLEATDNDSSLHRDGQVLYSLAGLNESFFTINRAGELQVSGDLDRESQETLMFTIVATDEGEPPLSSSAGVTVTLTDIDDNSPSFTRSLYIGTLDQSNALQDVILTVECTDPDTPPNAAVEYSLDLSTPSAQNFQISSSGEIRARGPLSVRGLQTFRATCTGPAPGSRFDVATVAIDVIISENISFSSNIYNVTIPENVMPVFDLVRVSAASLTGASLRYRLSIPHSLFAVDGSTGILRLLDSLDYERDQFYVLQVEAYDVDDLSNVGEAVVNINVQNVNDERPSINTESQLLNITEGLVSEDILDLNCTDSDTGLFGSTAFRIAGGNTQSVFSISGMGVLRADGSIDYETVSVFRLEIVCEDGGNPPLRDTVTIPVNVLPINDNPPVFAQQIYTLEVAESVPVNSVIGNIVASDQDRPPHNSIHYFIASGNTDPPTFEIHRTTGQLTLIRSLDYDSPPRFYTLLVTAEDGETDAEFPVLNDTAIVNINVLNENDNLPVLSSGIYTGNVPETVAGAQVALATPISCSDADSDDTTTLSVSHPAFQISASGIVLTTRPLNYEEQQSYEVQVQCSDSGSPPMSAEATLYVTVTDINEFSPRFTNESGYIFNVPESATVGVMVGRISAIDEDGGPAGVVTYTFLNDTMSPFGVSSQTGVITLLSSLDFETQTRQYSVQAEASDASNDSNEVTIVFNILDVDDNLPVFSRSIYFYSIRENAPVGSTVGQIQCTDADNTALGVPVVYSIESSPFIVNTDGVIQVDGDIDLEAIPRYTLRAVCMDVASNIAYANVTITLLPFNDFEPVFLQSSYNTTITENSPSGLVVQRVQAVDDDLVNYFQIEYSIIGGNSAELFSIDPITGDIRVNGAVDREADMEYTLTVLAQNSIPPDDLSGSSPLNSTVEVYIMVLDVNDNDPVIGPSTSPAPVYISESAGPMAIVTHLTCNDSDNGLNGTTRFLIEDAAARQRFQILSNGTIVTTQVLREDETLAVTCLDFGSPPRSSSVSISIFTTSVNNYPPEFSRSNFVLTVPENFTIGETVGCITATDRDGSDTPDGVVQYSLRYLGDDVNRFRIRPSDGCIVLSLSLDYDEAMIYEYEIAATDSGVPSLRGNASLTVQITDFVQDQPMFQNSIYTRSIPENVGSDFTVVQVQCIDLDFDDSITYSILNVIPQFAINSTSGVVKTTSVGLDYETAESYSLQVSCRDSSLLRDQAEVIVTIIPINEFPPYFVSATVHIDENSIPNTRVTSLDWVDRDSGLDGAVGFNITSGNTDETFSITPSGQVLVRGPVDRERVSFYSLNITIFDLSESDPRSNTGQLNITVLDINDNQPQFTRSTYEYGPLEGNETVGYFVGQVSCTDTDTGSNGDVSYRISPETPDPVLFTVDSMNGVITVGRNLSDRSSDVITFTVLCADMGSPVLEGNARVLVRVEEINRHEPQFLNSSYTIHVAEDAGLIPSTLLTVQAADRDTGINGMITYSLLDSFNNLFFIDGRTGTLSLLRSLDFEDQSFYELVAIARDGAADSRVRLRDTVPIEVYVTGVNEYIPRCRNVIYTAIINSTSQGNIIDFQCMDDDSGPDGQLDYSFLSGNGMNHFTIEMGQLVIATPVPPPSGLGQFRLEILVQDMGVPPRSVIIQAILLYSFDNLAAPSFDEISYSFTVPELTEVGTVVATVNARDSDSGIQGQVTYSVNGSDNFRIDPNNGNLYLASALDWERDPFLSFHVFAIDNDPVLPLSGYAVVNISVLNENDNPPRCDRSIYTSQILSNATVRDNVVTITCSDLDRTPLTYSILSTTSVFQIEPTTGLVYVAQPIANLQGRSIVIDVEVSDADDETIVVPVNIAILFANQNPPVFQSSLYNFYIAETAATVSTVGLVLATDSDSPAASLRYSLVTGGMGVFYLDPISGRIILTAPLDYEALQEYTLAVRVSDGGSFDGSNILSGTASVVIHVNNTNDNQPTFSNGGIYGSVVPELTRVGSQVVSMSCTDRDAYPFGTPQITADISDMIPFELEVLGAGRAEVRVSGPLSGPNTYIINITCTDGERLSSGQVFLFIPEPLAPVFSSTSYEWLIRETASTGSSFESIQATSNFSAVTYSIADGNSDGTFYIDPSTGVLSLVTTLDYETQQRHGLIIRAVDADNREANVLLLVPVLDVDDDLPLIPPSALFTVRQYQPPRYPVGAVQCVDVESRINSSLLNYTFNIPTSLFSIDEIGVVWLEMELDETPVYILPVVCFDIRNPQRNSTGIVTVEVEFVNLYSPTFSLSTYQFLAPEDFPALVPLGPPVVATDGDIGSFGQFTYSILSDQDQFFINSVNGTIESLTSLDRETQDYFNFTIAAIDGGPSALNSTRRTGTATVFVTVLDANDNSPTLDQLSYVQTITTNHSVGSPVLTVACSDPDQGINGTTSFSLSPSSILEHFSIQSDGTIILNQQQPNQAVYTFSALCSDRGVPSRTSSSLVTVIVNFVALGAPVFDSDQYNATIPESTSVTTSILRVHATPSDASITVVYEIVSGNDGDSFFLNSDTGELSVRNPLDAREQQIYTLSVRAGNLGSEQLFSFSTVAIQVEDVNDNFPMFLVQLYTRSVYENASVPAPVLILDCTDSDVNSDIMYFLTGTSPFLSSFNITQTGLLYVAGELDYESASTVTLEALCIDGYFEPRSASALVRLDILPVNEARPRFSQDQYFFQATENDFGALIGRISASDDDSGVHGSVSYLLQDPGNLSVIFVDPTDGNVYVSDNLDYETQQTWNLTVIVRDGGGLESVALLNIEVVNVNDEPPMLFPPVTVASVDFDRQPGYPVQSYICGDPDGIPTSIIIVGGNSRGYLGLDSNNILFWTGQASDLLSNTIISLTLRCQDTNDSSQYAESIIAVYINVTNAPPPVFSEDTYSIFLNENTTVDATVHRVVATAQNGSVTYAILSSPVGFPFIINSTDGAITLTRELNRETESFYSFFVSAMDNATLGISVALVEVTVLDVNDNPPVITPSMQSIRVSENYTLFTAPISFFSCVDSDTGPNNDISFEITSGDPMGRFSVNSNGQVFLTQGLDYEFATDYNLEITCSDSLMSPLTDTATLFIQVTSSNEHPPVFDSSPYLYFISELQPPGTLVGPVRAQDSDSGVDGTITYSIISATYTFTIDDTSGNIFVSRPLDFEQQAQYQVTVLARDNALDVASRMSATATVVIDIVQENEHTPTCINVIYRAVINSTSEGQVVDLLCSDNDAGQDGVLQYMILNGNERGYFAIMSGGLVIPMAFIPDDETGEFRMEILVTDMGLPQRNVTVEVVLSYSYDNLAAPMFNQSTYTLQIEELTPVGTVVAALEATDSDPSIQGLVTYSIQGSSNFRIDPSNGNLFLASPLDWEVLPYLYFVVVAQDSDPYLPLQDYALINVTVINNNDNAPQCDRYIYAAQVLSNSSTGQNVLTLNCSDLDGNPLRYSITSNLSTFSVNSVSGEVVVAGSIRPDFTYVFDIQVSGSDEENTNVSVSIAVLFANTEDPMFLQSVYNFSVPESTPVLSSIGQVQGRDGDSPQTSLTYSLAAGEFQGFYLHPRSGNLILTQPLDFEMTEVYTFTIQVSDSGSFDGSNILHGTATVNIHVVNNNDVQPMFEDGNIYGRTIPEVTSVGTVILSLTCTDGDAPPYGTPRVNADGLQGIPFNLTETSPGMADVTVSMPLTGEATFFINVSCSDGEDQAVGALVYVFIPEPRAPNFTQSSYDWYVNELAGTNTSFGGVRASSDDGSAIIYSIVDGNNDDTFTINQSSGVLSLVKSLDFEEQSQHGLLVQAVDGQGRRSNVLVLVHVINANDEVPLIPPSALITVQQNESPGSPLGMVQCVDADDRMNSSVFNYTFNSPSQQFSIDRTGVIYLGAELDETPVYVLPVTCFDVSNPLHNSTGIVTVEVEFINQYRPVFQFSSYNFAVTEDYPALSPLGPPLVATDQDIGSFGQVTYSILNDLSQFYVDPVTGTIGSLTPLDRENQDSYTLTAAAVDGGASALNSTRRTGTATVTVTVLDTNDNSPALDQLSYVQSIYTNHSVGSPVLSVACSDPDFGVNGTTTFSLSPSSILEHFSIQSDGTIILNQQQPNQAVYTFSALCSDRGVPPRTSSSLVTVIVNFVALGAPVFDSDQYNATIPESTSVTTSILRVHATPSDASITVVYEIVSGNDGDSFFLNSETGELSIRTPLDARRQQNYVLSVRAGNEGSNQLFSLATITIFVQDVNDNSPSFQFQFFTSMVFENATLTTPVLSVLCTDSDLNSNISYSISDVSAMSSQFSITSDGVIYVAGELDYEEETAHSLEVTCSDGGEEPRTARATVRVEVLPVNEFRPMFSQEEYNFQATENDFGALVGRIRATDEDNSAHGSITYMLLDPENASVVFVEPVSGVVRVSSNLDYETQPFWNLTVVAVDGGGLESSAHLNIEVINVNDAAPVLLPQTAVRSINVDEILNTPLQAYTCTDADGSDTTVSIINGNSAGFFQFDNGVVVWAGNTQNVTRNLVVSLTLQCFDNQDPTQSDESVLAVSIIVTDAVPPVFSESPYTRYIPENAELNSTVVTVSATGENTGLVYSFVNVPFGFPFSIDSTTGNITLSGSLNSEIESSFSFVVLATDPVADSVGLVFVEIVVVDVNDNPPEITPSFLSVRLPEDFMLGLPFTSFLCTDDDTGNHTEISFGIASGNDQGEFRIDRNGLVYLSAPLDFETTTNFSLVIVCSDSTVNPLSDTATLNVVVEGINEHGPEFTNSSYNFAVSEYARAGDLVGVVEAVDLDEGVDGELVYSVLSGTGLDYFSINSAGSIHTSILPLNSTESAVLQLNVRATDGGNLHGDAAVLVHVEDVNEPPLFSNLGNYFVRTSTNVLPGENIFSFTCYDTDTGSNSVVNTEISALPPLLDLYLFTVNRRGAQDVFLRANSTLPPGSFELSVMCRDTGSPPIASTTSITLRVESFNTAPTFTENVTTLVIAEDVGVGSSIFSVRAVDAETDVVYNIIGGTGLGTFQVNRDTGVVSVILPLDYETLALYSLIISATDLSPVNPLSATMEVSILVTNVNDEYPVLSPAVEQTINLVESSPPMTPIASYSCQDGDGTPVSIAISSEDQYFPFSISPAGNVTLTGPLDYEVSNSHTITVTCSDQEVRLGEGIILETSLNLRVVVTPENLYAPEFTSELIFNVSEAVSTGSIIASLEGNDSDSRGPVVFSSANPDQFLVSQNGSIQLLVPLDYEEATSHTLTVVVSDNDNVLNLVEPRTTSAVVTINVIDFNDNLPVCTSNALFVSFDTGDYRPSGLPLLHLNCSDRDSGINAELEYSLNEETLPNLPNGNFDINNRTGEMFFQGSIVASGSLILQVIVSDSGMPTLMTTVDVAVQIIDTNATRPRFNVSLFRVDISEHELSPSVILRGEIIRERFINPDNYTVEYSLRPDPEYNGIFIIDLLTADLSLTDNDLLDYDRGRRQYLLTLQATVNRAVETAIVEVNIEDFNDNTPRFTRTRYSPTVLENQPPGTFVVIMEATDGDSGENSMLRYSISGGNFPFAIDPLSGNVTTAISFDREVADRYTVFVLATDLGHPSLTGTATVNVLIGDENDRSPFFVENLYIVNINNTVQPGERILSVRARDEDVVGFLTFQINDEDTRDVFLIDSNGTIRVRSTGLPEDHPPRYNFTVEVSDGIQSDQATVIIYTVSVTSDTVLFAENDLDQMYDAHLFLSKTFNLSSEAEYTIFKGDPTDTFEITSDGVLMPSVPLDRENISQYELGIRVEDDVSNIDLEITVVVLDENDNIPEFSSSYYFFNVSEGHYHNERIIGFVNATDDDEPGQGASTIEYTIITPVEGIGVKSNTGELFVKDGATLDHEKTSNFSFAVQARDFGEPESLSTSALVDIRLEDINDNDPEFVPLSTLEFVVLLLEDEIKPNTRLDKIRQILPLGFETDVEVITVRDPDTVGTTAATIEGNSSVKPKFAFRDPNAAMLELITTDTVTREDLGVTLQIVLRDEPEEEEENPVIRNITFLGPEEFGLPSTGGVVTEPPDFFETEAGIAVLVVICLLIVAVAFGLFCLVCCIRIRREKDPLAEGFRTTTIAQRILTEVDRKTKKKRKGLGYDQQDATLMEFPDLSPEDYDTDVLYPPGLHREHSFMGEQDREGSYKEPFIPIPGDEFGEPLTNYNDDFSNPLINRQADPFNVRDTETSALSSTSGDFTDLAYTSRENLTNYSMGPVLQAMLEEWQKGDEILSKKKKKRKVSRSGRNTSQEELSTSTYFDY